MVNVSAWWFVCGRVIPYRWTHPEAYRLFLELVSWYALAFERDASESARDK